MDRFGYCKTVDRSVYERNQETVDSENAHGLIRCMSRRQESLSLQPGNLHQIKVSDIPAGKMKDKGTPIDNISKYDGTDEEIIFLTCGAA